jgi:hypothetical protein
MHDDSAASRPRRIESGIGMPELRLLKLRERLHRHAGPRAVLNALERLIGGYAAQCEHAKQDLALAESQLRDYQARLGAAFPHTAYLAELTQLRDQLKAGLAGANPEPGAEPLPLPQELAERIKALRAAQSIEAPSPRTNRRGGVMGEEPVTTRIRRRNKTPSTVAPPTDPNLDAPPAESSSPLPSTVTARPPHVLLPETPSNGASRESSAKHPATYPERINWEKRLKKRQLSIF